MADVIKVVPSALSEASSQAVMHLETAAVVHPDVVPSPAAGSAADAAAAAISAAMATRVAEMAASSAAAAPQVQTGVQRVWLSCSRRMSPTLNRSASSPLAPVAPVCRRAG
jgi:hypothetical protein